MHLPFVDYLFICFCNIPQYHVENKNVIKNARYDPITKASVGKHRNVSNANEEVFFNK